MGISSTPTLACEGTQFLVEQGKAGTGHRVIRQLNGIGQSVSETVTGDRGIPSSSWMEIGEVRMSAVRKQTRGILAARPSEIVP